MYLNLNFVDPEDDACVTEEDLGIQLEEWEGSEEKQDAPPISAIEDSLMFESKYKILCGNSLFYIYTDPTVEIHVPFTQVRQVDDLKCFETEHLLHKKLGRCYSLTG